MKLRTPLVAMLLIMAACGTSIDTSSIADLTEVSTDGLITSIQDAGRPAVVNV